MSFSHLTLPSQHVARTARFLEDAFGYRRMPVPADIPVETVWLDVGCGQTFHVFFVDGFRVSPFEAEFGRHVAVFYPLSAIPSLRERLARHAVEFVPEVRKAPFARFFFREPINGYFFEVIDDAQAGYTTGQPR